MIVKGKFMCKAGGWGGVKPEHTIVPRSFGDIKIHWPVTFGSHRGSRVLIHYEPRSHCGRHPNTNFHVTWLPNMSYQDAKYAQQTSPQSTTLTRHGDRYGLRSDVMNASQIHAKHRPDTPLLLGRRNPFTHLALCHFPAPKRQRRKSSRAGIGMLGHCSPEGELQTRQELFGPFRQLKTPRAGSTRPTLTSSSQSSPGSKKTANQKVRHHRIKKSAGQLGKQRNQWSWSMDPEWTLKASHTCPTKEPFASSGPSSA